ncbi:glycosyltransferase family 2 protein [Geodermatophilus sp. SYSU D00691]
MPNILVVCPSITAEHARSFCAAAQAAVDSGADLRAVLVANSTATQELVTEWPEIVIPGDNAGFAASINRGVAAGGEFRWLVVANDDLDYDAGTFRQLAEVLGAEPATGHRMLRLNDEGWQRLPGIGGVFTNLSLLEKVTRRGAGIPRPSVAAPSGSAFPGFSLVAITADLWDDVGGMEEALPFCFEDAWFVRRARASAGGLALDTRDLGVRHRESSTTRANIRLVLPVISWSALVYLQLLGVPAGLARALCVAALIVRAPLSLLASAARGPHLLGIGRSIRAVATGREPRLPAPGMPVRA